MSRKLTCEDCDGQHVGEALSFLTALHGDDHAWWHYTFSVELGTGNCGGCGNFDCHEGPCTQVPDAAWLKPTVCGLCPERVMAGQVKKSSAPHSWKWDD